MNLHSSFISDFTFMSYILVGLGNPGEEYENTRHNVGRMALENFAKGHEFSEWKENAKYKSRSSEGKIVKDKVLLLEPETFMNKSGQALASFITSPKKAENLVVIHDDLDLPLGKAKMSWNRGSGGHKGVESIIKNIKTETFTRIRLGISPQTPAGKLKKPKGEEAVNKLILGKFKDDELADLKKTFKNVSEALEQLIAESRENAMGKLNSL